MMCSRQSFIVEKRDKIEEKMDKINFREVMNKIAQYRGVIITDSINIEALISSILINYFAKEKKHSEFLTKVIEDELFSFGLKINILEKLNFDVYNGFFQDIRRINNIRNIFAHCLPGSFTGGLSYYNKEKKIYEVKELEEFHKEFLEKIKKVDKQLEKTFFELIEKNKKG